MVETNDVWFTGTMKIVGKWAKIFSTTIVCVSIRSFPFCVLTEPVTLSVHSITVLLHGPSPLGLVIAVGSHSGLQTEQIISPCLFPSLLTVGVTMRCYPRSPSPFTNSLSAQTLIGHQDGKGHSWEAKPGLDCLLNSEWHVHCTSCLYASWN